MSIQELNLLVTRLGNDSMRLRNAIFQELKQPQQMNLAELEHLCLMLNRTLRQMKRTIELIPALQEGLEDRLFDPKEG